MRIGLVVILAMASGCGTSSTTGPSDMATARPPVDYGPETPIDGSVALATNAVVTTSSAFSGGKTGALDTVHLTDHVVSKMIDSTLDGDSAVTAAEGHVFVLDRTHGTLRVYDPSAKFAAPIEIATGDTKVDNALTNPHDALVIPATSKIYVGLYSTDADHAIGVVDWTTPKMGVTKWIAVPKAGSAMPRVANLYFCGPYVYALVDDLDNQYAVTGAGRIIVIDPRTDALVPDAPVIALTGSNPAGGTNYGIAPLDPKGGSCDMVVVSNAGDGNPASMTFGKGSNLEQVDLTRKKSLGALFSNTDSGIGGSITTVSVATKNIAYLGVNLVDGTTKVVAVDPTGKKVLGDAFGPAGFIPFAEVSPDGQIFVGVAEGPKGRNGLFIGAADGTKITSTIVQVDQSPYAIAFY